MRRTAEKIASDLGLSGDLVLLQLSNNAIFAVPDAGAVIRITRSRALGPRAAKAAALGSWFADVDAPTIRLSSLAPVQPLEVDGLAATIWVYLSPLAPTPDVTDLGRALRTFHNLGAPPFDLPAWDPVGDTRTRIADAEALDTSDQQFLLDWCDRLEPQIVQLNREQPPVLVHGDAHVGNLLRANDHQVALCDFDGSCLGPWQFDLVAVPVGEERFGRPGVHAELAAAYGYDVTTDPAWPVLRQARELKMVAGALPRMASSAAIRQEFKTRLESIWHDDGTARWTPFAALEKN
ncbi:aminoglycoside phosphotransferase family protein [Actinoplanes sp. NPDC026619]|uniref:phosphotransferase enzyme family protein n=1 Tax=Actinoplanes sp. NPDC026619 TaxID=3155798 RepID=UPI0033F68498